MNASHITAIAMAIVGVAFLTVAVTHTQTASIITAFGNAFSGSLKASMGN